MAKGNIKEVMFDEPANIDMDEEDLNDIVNKISKIVLDEMIDVDNDIDLDEVVRKMMMCQLQSTKNVCYDDTQFTSRSAYSSKLSEGLKSKIKKTVEGYSRVGVSSITDLSVDQSRMAKIEDGGYLNRCKNMDHSNNDSSTCTSPMKKVVVVDEIIDVEKDATLSDSVNKKRKEATTTFSNTAPQLNSKDNDHSTKKARYDHFKFELSVQHSEKYRYELRRKMEINFTQVGKYSVKDVMFDQDDAINSPMVRIYHEDVEKRYQNFKKFDVVMDHSDHLFSQRRTPLCPQQPTDWVKTIHEEWRSLEENLPDRIFVRAYEPRRDLLRAVIIGAEGTPYHDGLFFFDVHFPIPYPRRPPFVRYHSGGLGINPNLYMCGEVRLSLPITKFESEELWVPSTSNMLQLLVSIQNRCFTTDPIYCSPAFVTCRGVRERIYSVLYNESTFIASLKTMMYIMNKPPKNFEAFVVGHFRKRVRDILMACKAYIEGVQVGRVVSGECNENSTRMFRYEVTKCIKPLVAAFIKIGATEAEEFLHLSEMKKQLPASAPTLRSITTNATES